MKNYYAILGIRRSATPSEVRSAYRNLSLMWHPDRNPPSRKQAAHERFIEIAEAYETLSDPAKRSYYDAVCVMQFTNATPRYGARASTQHTGAARTVNTSHTARAARSESFVVTIVRFFFTWYAAMVPVGIVVSFFTLALAVIWCPLAKTFFVSFVLFALLFPFFFIVRSAVRATTGA